LFRHRRIGFHFFIGPVFSMRYRLGRTLITTSEIQARVQELATAISADYAERDLLLICVLKGGAIFWADLCRALHIPCQSDFVAMESYAEATSPLTEPRFTKAAEVSLVNRDILIVEDIIDTGHTGARLRELLRAQSPRSLAMCALLDKAERRQVATPIEYGGFVIPNAFVVGYGLDYAQQYRHLPHIAILEGVPGAEGRKRAGISTGSAGAFSHSDTPLGLNLRAES
jgi:hypoxanthine phosphoribosyltransferase